MNARLVALLLAQVFVVAAFGGICLGDDAAVVPEGGAVKAMENHPSIEMVSEKVTVRISGNEAKVEAAFVFHNTGRATTVLMGFPESGPGYGSTPAQGRGFRDFRTFVDGKPAKTRLMPGRGRKSGDEEDRDYSRWWVNEVWFGKGQTRKVRSLYRCTVGEEGSDWRLFNYTLATGATWKGTIGMADITVQVERAGDFSRLLIAPDGYTREGNEIVWHFEDFEPATRIEIGWSPFYYGIRVDGEECRRYGQSEIRSGMLRVPVGLLAEWLGAKGGWKKAEVKAVFERKGRIFSVAAGDNFITLDGRAVPLPVPVEMQSGHLMVPLRAVAVALGCKVLWDPVSRKTYVSTPEKVAEAAQAPEFLSLPLIRDELGKLTAWELSVMKNEIPARHGKVFEAPDWREYFYSQPWYEPNVAFNEGLLTELERQNLRLIEEAEEEKERTPSPEGKIAFSADKKTVPQVWVMDADGSNLAQLTNLADGASDPCWSPDGSRIAFTAGGGNWTDIRVMNADGSNQVRLTQDQGGDSWPTWSPDGTKIVFSRYIREQDPHHEVWSMNADGSGQYKLDIPTVPIYASARAFAVPRKEWSLVPLREIRWAGWSPDGSRLMLTSEGWICLAEVDAADPTRFTRTTPVATRIQQWVSPRWSPDGKKIVFCSGDDIHVMASDGSNGTNVTKSEQSEGWPAWSPDGSKIAFAVSPGWICVMDADGGNRRKVIKTAGPVGGLSWAAQ